MTGVALTDGFPLTLPDGVTGQNNAHDIRKGLLATLMLPNVVAGNASAVRPGVFPHYWDANGCATLRVQAQGGPTANLDVLAGSFVCERIGQGPYIGWSEFTTVVTPTTSNPSNPRIDVIYAVVYDQAAIGGDPFHGPRVDILAGTPSGTPVVPTALPDGAVPLAHLFVAAGATTYGPATLTDVRKSSGLTGAVRYMLPGDAVTDPGKIDGELRLRQPAGLLPSLVDYWDTAQSKWRGTQTFSLTANFPGSGNPLTATYGSNSSNTIISMTVPDPGYPYRLQAHGMMNMAAISAPQANTYVYVSGGAFIGSMVYTYSSGSGMPIPICPTGGNSIYNGSVTVVLRMDVVGTGTAKWFADNRNNLTVNVIPA